MDKFPLAKLSVNEESTPTMELPRILEQNYKPFVPKIRIRLRPNSEQINSNSDNNVYGTLIDKSECENIAIGKVTKNDYIDSNSETKCYKVLEDSGGGGGRGDFSESEKAVSYGYMIHGINLRARLPKPITVPRKLKAKEARIDKEKSKTAYQTENDIMNKSSIKSICTKNSYKSYILNSSKNHRKKENDNRKSISKVRNEIVSNINFKDIVNHENFLKLSSEIQWQLANLLPNCDKPKSSDSQSSCHCSDVGSSIDEQQRIYPNVSFNALNNEFLGKALTKYSMKMGQCDLLNLLTSERENLRSRSLPMLSEDLPSIDLLENGVKKEECDITASDATTDDTISSAIVTITSTTTTAFTATTTSVTNNNNDEDEDIKPTDDIKSNSSVCSTETMEMNGTGNLFENLSLKIEQYSNIESKSEETCDRNYVIGTTYNTCDDANEGSSSTDKYSVGDSQCDKTNILETQEYLPQPEKGSPIDLQPDPYQELPTDYSKLTQNLSIDTTSVCHQLNTSDLLEDKRRRRGRKRKCFNISDDTLVVPVKRSSRSTAGKRPARLDSESPPTSPNHTPTSDRKSNHNKLSKKQKERNRNIRKSKIKQEHSSDDLDNITKPDVRPKKHGVCRDILKYHKNYLSSPESLPNESDLSPLSKPSPNGSSVMSNFCRSSLASFINDKKSSSHVNSVQALSPSWSCTSESTTPSVKSDYGHIQPTKTSPSLCGNTFGHIDFKPSSESDSKPIQGMPPPRQTLTLAAMREKMRAKKMAKEDNRRDSNSPYQTPSPVNDLKIKKPKTECSSLLKEGDDDSQMMDKLMNSSEEFDELLYNSQDSLLEFFMGDDNYEFDGAVEQSSDISTFSQKPFTSKRSKVKSLSEEVFIKDEVMCSPAKTQSSRDHSNRVGTVSQSKIIINKSGSHMSSEEQVQSDKSIADTIATVLQKLNSKENGIVINNNNNNTKTNTTKTSAPNAYLVDGNGLSNALSIIQSLNPGAKVTTQQFYLVNSGPQLILQPSPPVNIVSEKQCSSSSLISSSVQNKVSLAPKLVTQSPMARPQLQHHSAMIHNGPICPPNDTYQAMSLNHLSFNSHGNDQLESMNLLRHSPVKMPVSGDSHNAYMVSPISHSVPNVNQCSTAVHLQTISTPHQIGLVHSALQAPPLPSLFSSQLRFVHPGQHSSPNTTISLIPSPTTALPNNQQSPKLLFLCPTVQNQTASTLVSNPNILNQDQKYLLLSKQPDKQATIQLVSSHGLWQQLNPTMISQANNLVVMPPQSINSLDSLLSSTNLHNMANRTSECQVSQASQYMSSMDQHKHNPTSTDCQPPQSPQCMSSMDQHNKHKLYTSSIDGDSPRSPQCPSSLDQNRQQSTRYTTSTDCLGSQPLNSPHCISSWEQHPQNKPYSSSTDYRGSNSPHSISSIDHHHKPQHLTTSSDCQEPQSLKFIASLDLHRQSKPCIDGLGSRSPQCGSSTDQNHQSKQYNTTTDYSTPISSSSLSLIIDSRSLISKLPQLYNDDLLTTSLSTTNHSLQNTTIAPISYCGVDDSRLLQSNDTSHSLDVAESNSSQVIDQT